MLSSVYDHWITGVCLFSNSPIDPLVPFDPNSTWVWGLPWFLIHSENLLRKQGLNVPPLVVERCLIAHYSIAGPCWPRIACCSWSTWAELERGSNWESVTGRTLFSMDWGGIGCWLALQNSLHRNVLLPSSGLNIQLKSSEVTAGFFLNMKMYVKTSFL